MRITVKHVQEIVAEHFEAPMWIMGARRLGPSTPQSTYRHTAMFFARQATDHSNLTIARLFRRADHSTTIYAERKIRRLGSKDAAFAAELKAIATQLGIRFPVDDRAEKAFAHDSRGA